MRPLLAPPCEISMIRPSTLTSRTLQSLRGQQEGGTSFVGNDQAATVTEQKGRRQEHREDVAALLLSTFTVKEDSGLLLLCSRGIAFGEATESKYSLRASNMAPSAVITRRYEAQYHVPPSSPSQSPSSSSSPRKRVGGGEQVQQDAHTTEMQPRGHVTNETIWRVVIHTVSEMHGALASNDNGSDDDCGAPSQSHDPVRGTHL